MNADARAAFEVGRGRRPKLLLTIHDAIRVGHERAIAAAAGKLVTDHRRWVRTDWRSHWRYAHDLQTSALPAAAGRRGLSATPRPADADRLLLPAAQRQP